MEFDAFRQLVVEALGVEPTDQQRALIDALCRFCSGDTPPLSVFLLNGYAGTGKTSVVAALVKALRAARRQAVLLAPTGRAAKVLSTMAGRKAFTIHRKIYRSESFDNSVAVTGVADNPHRGAIFIVDEASMIGGGEQSTLLDDLAQYVYGSGDDCRMILLGDTAQLPPVGCAESPAMTVAALRRLGLRVSRAVLTQTVRQASRSGILYNATALRRWMKADPRPVPTLRVTGFSDVKAIGGEDLEEALGSSYNRYGVNETILITRSNKRAMLFNLAIRQKILEKDIDLTCGEPVMIAKNNYFWTSKIKGADFVANGDIAVVSQIYGTEIRGFLRFADVALTMDNGLTFDCKLILNSLNAETAGLNPEHEQWLLQQALRGAGPETLGNPRARAKLLREDPYFNALRVKYAYAVTCHKAQGGQWESVFVDMAYIPDEAATSLEFYRWLYTATSRARSELVYVAPGQLAK